MDSPQAEQPHAGRQVGSRVDLIPAEDLKPGVRAQAGRDLAAL